MEVDIVRSMRAISNAKGEGVALGAGMLSKFLFTDILLVSVLTRVISHFSRATLGLHSR